MAERKFYEWDELVELCKKHNIDIETSCCVRLRQLFQFLEKRGVLPEEDILNYWGIYYIDRRIPKKVVESPFTLYLENEDKIYGSCV